MDKLNEDILTKVFEYIPNGSFLFIAPVGKDWERSYKKSDCGLFTSAESIVDSYGNMEYAYENGCDIELFCEYYNIEKCFNTVEIYDIIECLIMPSIRDDRVSMDDSTCFIYSICEYMGRENYNIDSFLDFVDSFDIVICDSKNDMFYESDKVRSVIVGRHGYTCGPCHTCWKCEYEIMAIVPRYYIDLNI